jgi:hypothetical protein
MRGGDDEGGSREGWERWRWRGVGTAGGEERWRQLACGGRASNRCPRFELLRRGHDRCIREDGGGRGVGSRGAVGFG